MDECWLPIPGFEHCGEVSNYGRIRSTRGNIRKTVIGNTGYVRVGLKKVGAKNTNYVLLHRLVALAFCEGSADDLTVNHKDADKTNNRSDNLEWVTSKQNVRHAYDMGLRKNAHRKPRIPHEDRDAILAQRNAGKTYREIALQYGVNHSSVVNFVLGRNSRRVQFAA